MLRDLNTLWLTCVMGFVVVGCSTAKNYNETPVVNPNYDRYYGQPQSNPSNHGSNSDTFVSSIANDDWDTPQRSSSLELNPNAPDSYTVKKGDTLWDIAGKFLKHPWRWPEIWGNNREIKNPHLIYPGDVIRLENGMLSYNGRTLNSGNTMAADASTLKLKPRIRIERTQQSLIGEPINTLAAFTFWPKLLSADQINKAPYIVASQDNTLLIAPQQKIYVRNLRGAQVGQQWGVYHPSKKLNDPSSKRILGVEANLAGIIEINTPGELTTATVIESQREIQNGDRVFPLEDHTIQLHTAMTEPTHKVRADIISMLDANYLGGNRMVAVINKGAGQGIHEGYVLGVYAPGSVVLDPYQSRKGQYGTEQKQAVRLPPEKVANLVIFKTDRQVSYGLIMDASREVKNGYKIGNP
ncbi:LysM peptidoglycan-binding domain-containing protein [Thiofilum flexile]|uniref:LysM peptidoglycan-binding domain-containing protein n=1 Tax=Thiofilum flexile TaxID=125627 RepID=UPI000374E52F|nr:LysM peptidoglycan-binding domain-containing protein [Thiofilum flexile]